MSLDTFIRLADGIVEFEADLNDNQYPVASIHALEVHRNELELNWNRSREAFERYLAEIQKEAADEEDPVDLESIKLKQKSTYITYCKCVVKLSEIAETLRGPPVSRPQAPPPNIAQDLGFLNSISRPLHVPPIEIETFHGDYSSWPTFRDTFSAVISNSKASNVEKLFFLIQKTKGEAREIVQKCPLTHQGFDIAWNNLCLRFENRRVLVNGQLKLLFNLQTIQSESGKLLKQLQRDINSCISLLKLYDIDVDSWDPIFVYICTSKIPESTLTLWEQGLKDKTAIPKWSELDEFLTNRYRTLESVSEIRSTTSSKAHESKSKNSSNSNTNKKVNSFQTNVTNPKCQMCPNQTHAVRKCPKFLQMTPQQRFDEIKREGLCINCFSKTHSVRNCTSKHNCFKCKKRHNTLLHKENENANSSNPSTSAAASSSLNPNSVPYSPPNTSIQSTPSTSSGRVQSCFSTHSKGVLLGTAWVNICHSNSKYQVRALIDSGSEGIFISERIFNLLKLPSTATKAQISGLNNSISAKVQYQCSFMLSSQLNSDVAIPVTALVVPQLSNNLPSQTIPKSQFSNIPDIQLADPKFYSSSKIDMLIGGDIFPSIICSGIKHNVCDTLIAQETIFGWILTGPISHNPNPSPIIVSNFCEISLDKEISRFWEVEDLPRKNIISPLDKVCEDLFVRTTVRNPEGRYIVSLPFKNGFPHEINVGNSRSSALAQFLRNESRLIRNPDFKIDYDKVVQEYEDLGHMSKVDPKLSNIPNVYYLPHHAVIKPDSITTKVRVVFNASSPSSNGESLNSLLHVGPVLQSDLTLLILKWRFFKYVFNADIQKMYRQILVNPEHTPFQRILFRNSPTSPICDYEL